MRTKLIVVGLIFAACLAVTVTPVTQTAQAYPQPSIVPSSWQFDFTWNKPSLIALEDIDGQTHWYWFIAYKVVNNTGEERLFIPEFIVATDQGEIINTGTDVPASAFGAIKKRLGDDLLLSPIAVAGKLLQGEDYAKTSVAIWPASEVDVDRFDIFVAGLSGETEAIVHPTTGEKLVMKKTLMLSFETPGTTAPNLQDQAVIPAGSQWVMR